MGLLLNDDPYQFFCHGTPKFKIQIRMFDQDTKEGLHGFVNIYRTDSARGRKILSRTNWADENKLIKIQLEDSLICPGKYIAEALLFENVVVDGKAELRCPETYERFLQYNFQILPDSSGPLTLNIPF